MGRLFGTDGARGIAGGGAIGAAAISEQKYKRKQKQA